MFYDCMEVEKKMKRILAVFLALALTASTATVAFAKKGDEGVPSGEAEFGYLEVDPGDFIELDTDWFYGKWTEKDKEWDREKKKDVTVTITHEEPVGRLYKEYHTVSASWRSGAQYIQGVYFEEGDSYVTIEIKGGIASTVDREISGTVKIVEKNVPNRKDTVTYECDIKKGTLVLKGIDEKTQMVESGNKEFELPDDYQEKQVRFTTEDGYGYGTFIGDFRSEKSGDHVAEFRVRIVDQGSLYLGFSESANKTVANKYPDADLRFINWTARPTFAREGKLSIYMDPDEYIYGINDDNTLYRLGGKYDEDNDAYVITTKTLGNYVISDTQLTATSSSGGTGSTGSTGSTGGSTTVTPPSSSAPASTPAPSVATPSSVAPPPPSSSAPVSTPAPSSSSEEEQSSEPEDDEDDESSSSSSSISEPDEPDDDDDEKDNEKTEKKKFPLIPVLLGVLGIAILVCAVVVVGNRNSGKRARSRRRRYDDDWDD